MKRWQIELRQVGDDGKTISDKNGAEIEVLKCFRATDKGMSRIRVKIDEAVELHADSED